MSKYFRLALGLWVTPDFSAVMAGRAAPPRVNHDKVDFGALRALLQKTFHYGPPVDILVPNDTVDQVTAHGRMGMIPGVRAAATEELKACRDFGRSMLDMAGSAVDGVIDVRASWMAKHGEPVRDRRHAPPPSLVPFVVVAADFEDAQIWHASARPLFGLKALNPMAAAVGDVQSFDGGRLPAGLAEGLGVIFGCEFETSHSLLDRLSMDQPPAGYGMDREGAPRGGRR
ncbi:hypothetical protein [Ottowia sp.]|uniref:hypothetical protein n=1 Tax=Ottowia sp. TaxID=1898956 RepID=UPI0025FFF846|nr:hypothetical protein [Ottowia sp.]MBK6616602.1 hypothetical protein [Ottowia sp.]